MHETYEIRMAHTGIIEFKRALRTTRVAVRDVRCIEGVRESDYDGRAVWFMRLQHAGGRIKVAHFAQATEFLALVQTHNPTVAITGLWPMPKPTRPPTRQEMDDMIRDAILARRVRGGRKRR